MKNELTEQVKRFWPRDTYAGLYFEYFFVSAAANIIFWRVALQTLGWPKITAGSFYFPHVLTGGILMMAAMAVLLIFLNKSAKFLSAIIGGAGFGIFIDELGKYITQDNNYFYQPAIGIIYIIFVIIFLSIRLFEKKIIFSPEEYAVNSLEMIKEALINNLDYEEKRIALQYLKKSDQENIVVKKLISLIENADNTPLTKNNFYIELRKNFRHKYGQFIKNPFFIKAVILFFMGVSLTNLGVSIVNFKSADSIPELLVAVSTIISGSFVVIGIYAFKFAGGRLATFRLFNISVLITIFATQYFLFVDRQFAAATGLFLNIIIYTALQYLIHQEELRLTN